MAALIACLATVHARQERMRMDFARPHPTGTRPPGRMFGFATAAEGKVFLFGGSGVNGSAVSACTIHTMDVKTFEWSVHDASGEVPAPRKLFVGEKMLVEGTQQIVIHGGWDCIFWPCFLPLPSRLKQYWEWRTYA